MKNLIPTLRPLCGAAALGTVLASGCGSLLPKEVAPALTYSLGGVQRAHPTVAVLATSSAPAAVATLIVNPTRAASGYDSPQMVYVRVAHQLEHFARSEWVDTPARMLAPLVVAALENTAGLRAIGPASGGVVGDLRLDTEVLQLQQEFGGGPSRARFAMRATLFDNATRKIISSRVFDETVASSSEDAYGGVVAANSAVQLVMEQLSRYCTMASESWRASSGGYSKPNDQTRTGR